MNTEAFHPDHLKPGDVVGLWRVLEPLGSGSFGRAFKAAQFDVHMKPSIFTGALPQVTVTQANTLGLFNIVTNAGSQANGYSSAVQVTLSPIAP